MDPQLKGFRLPRLLLRLAVLTCGLSALSTVVASPADTLTPSVVNLTLPAGQSTTVNKMLHLDGLPPKADIIVAIDTTGSMGTAIAQAKADANNICTNVKAAMPGARFAVVAFGDYPGMPLGSPSDVPYLLLTPGFVSDCTTFAAAIATMTAHGGGDDPEAYNRVFFEAYDSGGGTNPLVTTRDPQATQFLVVLGDAEPHSATAFGSCPAHPPSDFGRNGVPGGGDDLDTTTTIPALAAAHIKLLMIRYLSAGLTASLACYHDMATATGGTAVDSTNAGEMDNIIINGAAAVPYTVSLQVSAGCALGIGFSPPNPPPYGPFSGPQNINFTEMITAPTVPGVYSCQITAVLNPGGPTRAVETVNVVVVPGAPATLTLEPPTAQNVVLTQHCVTATVRDAFGNRVPNVLVQFTVSGANSASGTATTDANGQATFCYTGTNVGADLITARVPGTTIVATATKMWVAPTVDHYKCYKAHPRSADDEGDDDGRGEHHGDDDGSHGTVISIQDQFHSTPQRVTVNRPDDMCNPVNKNGEGIVQPTAHFKSYAIKSNDGDDDDDDGHDGDGDRHQKPRRQPAIRADHSDDADDDHDDDDDDSRSERTVVVSNQFGQDRLKVGRQEKLLVPSSKSVIPPASPGADPGAPPRFIDHYVCYHARNRRSSIPAVTLEDQFRREQVAIDGARLFCNPVKKDHAGVVTEILPRPAGAPDRLVCYGLKPKRKTERLVNMRDQFANTVLRVEHSEALCVPSTLMSTSPR